MIESIFCDIFTAEPNSICVCGGEGSEDNFVESVFFLLYVGSRNWTRVSRPVWQVLSPAASSPAALDSQWPRSWTQKSKAKYTAII